MVDRLTRLRDEPGLDGIGRAESGRPHPGGSNIRNISVRPYSSTAPPRCGGLRVPVIFELGSGLGKAERGPLIVPGERQTRVLDQRSDSGVVRFRRDSEI